MKRVVVSVMMFVTAFMLFTCGFSEDRYMTQENVKMIAEVVAMGDKIEVDVLSSEYTSGVHLVITHDATQYFDKWGTKISREDLKKGDKIEIEYSGQVMLSYPPQIVATTISQCD